MTFIQAMTMIGTLESMMRRPSGLPQAYSMSLASHLTKRKRLHTTSAKESRCSLPDFIAIRYGYLADVSGSLGTRVVVGDVNVVNVGDVPLSFRVRSNWDVKYSTVGSFGITYDDVDETSSGFVFSLDPLESRVFEVRLQTKGVERQDDLEITVDALEVLAVPSVSVVDARVQSR